MINNFVNRLIYLYVIVMLYYTILTQFFPNIVREIGLGKGKVCKFYYKKGDGSILRMVFF